MNQQLHPSKARIRQGPAADTSGVHPCPSIWRHMPGAPNGNLVAIDPLHRPRFLPELLITLQSPTISVEVFAWDCPIWIDFRPFFHLHMNPLGWKPPLRLATGAPQSSSPKDLWKQHAHLPGGNGAFDKCRGAVYLSLTLFGQSATLVHAKRVCCNGMQWESFGALSELRDTCGQAGQAQSAAK